MLIKAIEKKRDDDIWDMWLTLYPLMNSGKLEFKAFSEFKESLLEKNYSNKSYEEIEKEMLGIVEQHEGR